MIVYQFLEYIKGGSVGGCVSLLPTDPATLGGRPFRADFRVENLDSIEPDRPFSLLKRLARSEPETDMS